MPCMTKSLKNKQYYSLSMTDVNLNLSNLDELYIIKTEIQKSTQKLTRLFFKSNFSTVGKLF